MTRNRTNTRMRLCRLWLFFATSLSLPVNPPRVIASEQTQATYRLVVNTDIPGFGADALAERLKAELGVNIVVASEGAEGFGVLTVSWRSSRGEMAVSFHDPSRGVVLRVVSAPADVDKAMQLSVLLAANLFRDDATELMGPTPAPAPSPPAVVPPDPVSQAAATPLPSQRQYKLATFSFLHPLSTNGSDPDIRTRLNLNLLYGRVGELDGLQLGFFGVVGGNASGAQLSFLANVTQGTMEGIQGASVFNLAKGGVVGLQVAFLSNLSGSRVKGVQASLGANVAREKVTGGQVSSVNVADDVEGFQIGFINVANKVKGLQLGLINVADDVEGVPLGLVSVTKSGGVHPMFWYGTETAYNLGIKFATRYTYSALTASVGRDNGVDQLGPGALFGMRVPIASFFFDTDLGATYLFGGKRCCLAAHEGLPDDRLLFRWRALLGFSVSKHFSGFVGGSATAVMHFRQGFAKDETSTDLRPEFIAGVVL